MTKGVDSWLFHEVSELLKTKVALVKEYPLVALVAIPQNPETDMATQGRVKAPYTLTRPRSNITSGPC